LLPSQAGIIYKTTASGGLTEWAPLVNGQRLLPPLSILVQREYDSNLYGTTANGAYRIATNGVFTNLVQFPESNSIFPSGLIEGVDGNFYGTTQYGTNALTNYGTVFQMTFNGKLTFLYEFSGGNDGAYPEAALVQANDGNFYGTTTEGGSNNAGTIFKINATGGLATLYSFSGGDDGYFPTGALVQGSDGNLYGTTEYGGTNNVQDEGDGTIFRITTNGMLTTLASFNGTNGQEPQAALLQGSDGNFYGAASQGGANGFGTIFELTTNGVLISLVSFNGANGAYPQAPLVQVNDGSFFGTTYQGGASNQGTVFRLSFPSQSAPVFQSVSKSGGNVTFTWSASVGEVYQVLYASNLNQSNWNNLGGPFNATNSTMSASDSVSAGGGGRYYRVVMVP
jgi:uncharacterized repeat protein (TIGR03803 family)